MRRAIAIGLVLAAAVLECAPVQAATVRFPSDNESLQELIDASSYGDTVLIEPGRWPLYNIDLRNGITIRTESGDPASARVGEVSNAIIFSAFFVRDVVLEGFKIRSGRTAVSCQGSDVTMRNMVMELNDKGVGASLSSNVELANVRFIGNEDQAVKCDHSSVTITDSSVENCGQGVYCNYSDVHIERVTFRGNGRTSYGAGLWGYAGNVSLSDCVFESNEVGYLGSTMTTWWYAGEGGGVYLTNGAVLTASGTTFDSNHTWFAGAGLGLDGPGTRAELRDCRFVGNSTSTHVGSDGAVQRGAALSLFDGAEAILEDVRFENNWSYRGGGAVQLGGFRDEVRGEFVRCLFAGNEAGTAGNAICVDRGMLVLSNCTLSESVGESAVELGIRARGEIANCILWPGEIDCYDGSQHDVIIERSLAAGVALLCWQEGNLWGDPLFCTPRARDLSLCGDSPCLPYNNEWYELIGAVGVGCGPCGTAVYETSWGAIKAMFRGE